MAKTKKMSKTKTKPKKSARKARVPKAPVRRAKPAEGPDVPRLFRLNVEVGNLEDAAGFYGKLLGMTGRKQAGSRCYFACGGVTLQVVDVSAARRPHPAAKALYFTVRDLDAVHRRAKSLECLSDEDVHGVSGGEMAVRPWGERSFYVEDRWANQLCFVEAGTTYDG